MKHKIVIDAMRGHGESTWRWYTECRCGWKPSTRDPVTHFYGRPTWDAAFALGVAHLRQECKHV